MISRKLKKGYRFRVYNQPHRKGLHFENIMDHWHRSNKLHDKDVVEIRDFLSRYINKYVNQKNNETEISIRANLHAALRGVNTLEASK